MLRRCSNGFPAMFTCLDSLKLKSLILYSTLVVSSRDGIKHPLMVDFLVKSVGFSEKEAVSVVNKVSHPSKSTENSELVVDFLKGSGFDGKQIRKVIAGYPNVLRKNVDETLKPQIRAFEDLGISGSDLGQIISRHSDVLSRRVESCIAPAIGMLKSLFDSNEQFMSFMLQIKSPRLFYSQVCKNFPGNMLLMQNYGLSSERIKWLMLRSRILFWSTQLAESTMKGVEGKLGIPRTSDMFMYGIYALAKKKDEEKMESWLELLRSYGWSETDISTLLRKHPLILCLAENHLRVKLKYCMEDLGLGSDILATHPAILTYSMKRIVPRVAVRQTLMDRNLLKCQVGLPSFLKISESKFMTNYVLPYKENLPDLYENYTLATGYSRPYINTKKSELVVDFLKESGFDGIQIRKVIALHPNVLRKNVDKTLKPKIRAFEDFGFSGSNLGLIISRHPRVLDLSLESVIVPFLRMFKSLYGSNEHLVKTMLQLNSLLLFSSKMCKNFPANLLLLQSYGLTSERIKWLMLHSSFLFWTTQRAEKLVKRVEELGIPRTSEMFMYGIFALSKNSETKIESWLESLRSYGWSEADISTLLRKHPLSVGLAKNHLRLKLKYFMEDLRLGSDYLATHPALLTYSLEKRVVPRVAVRQTLMEEHLLEKPVSVYCFLMMAESKFMERFVLPYKKKLPQLYVDYIQSTGYSLSKT